MPEVTQSTLTNGTAPMSIDPSAGPPAANPAPAASPAPAPAPPSDANDACYACADAAIGELVSQHAEQTDWTLYGAELGPFALKTAELHFESSNGGAGAGVTALHAGVDTAAAKIDVTAASAGAEAGLHNADGSTGYHAGAHAALVHAEGTFQVAPGWSFTMGAGVGVEAEGAVGARDSDGDGRPELCARVELEGLVGVCFEPADVADAVRATAHAAESAARSLVAAFSEAKSAAR